jgi:hypothetical protein
MSREEIEAKFAGTLVKCILDWLYALLEPVLQVVKAVLLAMIAWLDMQILILRAFLLQFDVVAIAEEVAWSIISAMVEYVQSLLLSPFGGPPPEICAEFYQMFSDPLRNILDTMFAGVSILRERYKSVISFKDELDSLLEYWVGVKNELTALVEAVDDAIYWSRMMASDAAEAAVLE